MEGQKCFFENFTFYIIGSEFYEAIVAESFVHTLKECCFKVTCKALKLY